MSTLYPAFLGMVIGASLYHIGMRHLDGFPSSWDWAGALSTTLLITILLVAFSLWTRIRKIDFQIWDERSFFVRELRENLSEMREIRRAIQNRRQTRKVD